jgi:protease I
MPLSQLLNAPGNEALRAFFFTPVTNKTTLKGKKIAVLAADGFEEIELSGPVWYFRELGAQVEVVAPKFITSRHPIDVADFSRAVETWLTRH